MHNKRGNFYGMLLLLIMTFALLALFAAKSPTTGFAVKENKCFEGTAYGECSFVKPKYCDNGAFKPNCRKCGCNKDEFCQDDGNCVQKCSDGTLFEQCSENKPVLCFKGSLLENCFKCGCFTGQTCLQNGTCSGNIETGAGTIPIGAGAEEKKEAEEKKIIEKCSDGTLYGKCSIEKSKYCDNGNLVDNCKLCGCEQGGVCSDGKCSKESPKVGFLWDLFCKVFHSSKYNDCISDAARKQNK